MTSAPLPAGPARPAIGRRRLLRNSGLALSIGAIVAACGDGRTGLEEPGRVGIASPHDPLPTATVDDVVLLRTAQSLEYTALAVYESAAEFGTIRQLVDRFVEHHTAHADQLAQLIGAAGGEPFACANPWLMDRTITPVLDAIDGSDDVTRDVLRLAHAVETMVAASAQGFVGYLGDSALRRELIMIGATNARHAAALAMTITGTPEGYFSPALAGEELEPDDAGFPVRYAVPFTFGQLGTDELVVGARDDAGSRFSIIVQTPAENSYIYEHLSC